MPLVTSNRELRRIARRVSAREFAAIHAALTRRKKPTSKHDDDVGGRRYYVILDSMDDDEFHKEISNEV